VDNDRFVQAANLTDDGALWSRSLEEAHGQELCGSDLSLISARHDSPAVVEGMKNGARDFIEKPFDPCECAMRSNCGKAVPLMAVGRPVRRLIPQLRSANKIIHKLRSGALVSRNSPIIPAFEDRDSC
jgi:hypothetical protein